jgi:hypothetical protein
MENGQQEKTTAQRESETLKTWWTDERKELLHTLAGEMGNYGDAMKALWKADGAIEEARRLFGVVKVSEDTEPEEGYPNEIKAQEAMDAESDEPFGHEVVETEEVA